VIYLEQIPGPRLRPFVRMLWYARVPSPQHARERVLPMGRVQVILNLAGDTLTDCAEDKPAQRAAPSLVVGARSVYELIDTADMADLIGIVFEPAGFPLFANDAADGFSNRTLDLELVWGAGARGLRDRLRELVSPRERLTCLELWLLKRFGSRLNRASEPAHPAVRFALHCVEQNPTWSIGEIARRAGWSERRISTLFREQVGLSPKVWQRVQRFQRAVQQLASGAEVRWGQLAQECGFYDQAHFANEFRAFSGINISTYAAEGRTHWANHVRER